MRRIFSLRAATLLPVLLAGVYFLYIPFQFWFADPRSADPLKLYPPYYPLLFLPLFSDRGYGKYGTKEYLFFSLGSLFVLMGNVSGLIVLDWPGAYWMILAALPAVGLRFGLAGYLLVFLTPPFDRGLEILAGFPLRIYLSRFSAEILHLLDRGADFSGNTILFRGEYFQVDPACEGLKMLSAIMILILHLVHEETKKGGRINFYLLGRLTLFYIIPGMLFWLASNLARIVLLVAGRISEESTLHYAVGMILFATSTVAPLFLIKRYLFSEMNRMIIRRRDEHPHGEKSHSVFPALASICTSLLALWIYQSPYERGMEERSPFREISGFQKVNDANNPGGEFDDISVYEKDELRLIIKRGLNPLKIGHHPRICWTAVGYTFYFESEMKLGKESEPGGDLRMALLESTKGDPGKKIKKYYALLWWYQPAKGEITASEYGWRERRILSGESFQQINLFVPMQDKSEYNRIILKYNPEFIVKKL